MISKIETVTHAHCNYNHTLRIQFIATAPGVDLFLETPSELKSVFVVKTPIAPPKKCYNEKCSRQ